jgi:membrane protease YdiL (CAAX protease family)
MTKRNTGFIARIGTVEAAPPWSLTTVALTIVFAFLSIIIGTFIALAWFENQSFATLLGWIIGSILAIVFVAQTTRRHRTALRLASSSSPLPFIMFICVGFAVFFDLIGLALTGAFLPVPELLTLRQREALDWLLAIAFMLVAQPAAEELVFRGVAFPSLRAALGAWPGLIVTAALYAGFHMLAYPPDYLNSAPIVPIWYGLALPFLSGLIIGAVRAYTGSTRAAIAAHAAFGLFALLKLFAITG